MDKVKGLISIFNFIKEMNKLKYMTAKNIQEQIWHCFISDIPTDSTDVVLTDWQGIQDTADNEERIILWIKKPNFPICPQPPKSIIEWLEPGWDKYDTQVRYKKSLPGVSKEQIINFTDDEKREKDFQQWIKEREEWQKKYNKIRIVRNLFVELYNRYIDLGKSPDTIEFLCGSGLIRDKRNPHISHPILLKRCQIKFEAADNIIKICDTDVEPQICTEVLSFIDEINSDKVGVYQNRLQEESIHPFDKQNATKFLRELTHELCAESEFFDNNNANSKERITVVFSPTFFIRKRIDGAVRATEKVIAAIENKGEIPHHLLELPEASSQRILPTDYEEPDISRKLAALNGESTEILLSKEANSEQLQIAERIAKEDAVIVQGPPGTGKTHTIANLIGHFLAEGKSILVTSHTRKALSVLKEKLPKELQGLCVSILEDSNRDMERSIDSITDYMSKHSYAELKRKADSMRNERLDIVKRLSALRMKIYMEKRKECEPIVLDGESYSVSDAADFIRQNSERLVYYIPGEVKVNQSIPMSKSDLHYLYESNGILTPEIEHELSCNLPSPDTLPTPEAFDEEVSQRKEYEVTLAKLSSEMNIPLSFDCANNSIVGNGNTIIKNPSYSTLTELETLSKKIPSFTDWQIQAAADGRQNSMSRTEWENLVSAIERFANYEKAAVPALMGKTVTLGQYDSYLQQARSLLNDLRGHDGKIGWFTKFSNADLVRIHESVKINGAQISSAKDCDIALKFVELTEIRRYLEISWNKLMAYNGCPEFSHLGSDASNFCMNKLQEIRNYLNWYTTGYAELYKSIVDAGINDSLLFNLTGMESGAEMTQKIIDVVHKRIFTFIEAGRSLLHIAEIDKENKKLQQTLSSGDRKESRICRDLLQAVTKLSVQEYREYYAELVKIYDKYEIKKRRNYLISLLEEVAPEWASAISHREGIHGRIKCPDNIFDAWKYKQFDSALRLILQTPVEKLQEDADVLRKMLGERTTELVENSAWYHLLMRIAQDGTLQQSLNGWRMLVKKIGKGTGKNASMYRREARALMAHCQKAVPAWIMPVSKVFENFEPGVNTFDIIIVDEASQSDISVLAILYMAKKAIIVGDDKQVSPMAIGENTDKINLLRDSCLPQDLRLRFAYDGKTSIYELVSTIYSSLMLKEHFRCVPQIIGYSNSLCYDGKIRPLREAGSSPVSPQVIPFRVANGVRDGKQKINDEEAKTIVALLQACIEQPEYQGETFGIISLLGEEQAELIQKYISEHISPVIVEERKILCGTAAQFQGDERSVIFLSMVDSNDKDGPLRLVGSGAGESTKQRYNVAASRAKDQLWIVHSLDYKTDLQPDDIRRDLLEYADNPDAVINASLRIEQHAESPFEKSVGQTLVAMGYDIVPQWQVGAYRIDMVARYGEKKVAIECDGDRYHSGEEAIRKDMERQTILERVGWRFIRIRGSEYYSDPDKAINRIERDLNSMGIFKQVSEANTADATEHDKLKSTVINRAAQIIEEWGHQPQEDTTIIADDNIAQPDIDAHDIEVSQQSQISDTKAKATVDINNDDVTPPSRVMKPKMSQKRDITIKAMPSKYSVANNATAVKHKAENATPHTKSHDSILEWRHTAKPTARDSTRQAAIEKKPPKADTKVETANGTDKFITILQSGGIEFIDNSGTSNIIWVLYKKDAQAIVEQAAAALGFSCKLYKRGSMATSNRPAWMILIH